MAHSSVSTHKRRHNLLSVSCRSICCLITTGATMHAITPMAIVIPDPTITMAARFTARLAAAKPCHNFVQNDRSRFLFFLVSSSSSSSMSSRGTAAGVSSCHSTHFYYHTPHSEEHLKLNKCCRHHAQPPKCIAGSTGKLATSSTEMHCWINWQTCNV